MCRRAAPLYDAIHMRPCVTFAHQAESNAGRASSRKTLTGFGITFAVFLDTSGTTPSVTALGIDACA